MSAGSAAWFTGLGGPVRSSRGCGAGPGRLDGLRAVQQRLAAQPLTDTAGFADRGRRGLGLAAGGQVGGVVEQAVGQVVGGGVLAQPIDRGGERRGGCVRVVVGGGAAGAGQIAFGALHGGQLPGRVSVQQGQQVAGGGGVSQVVRGAGGQRPGPPQDLVADL